MPLLHSYAGINGAAVPDRSDLDGAAPAKNRDAQNFQACVERQFVSPSLRRWSPALAELLFDDRVVAKITGGEATLTDATDAASGQQHIFLVSDGVVELKGDLSQVSADHSDLDGVLIVRRNGVQNPVMASWTFGGSAGQSAACPLAGCRQLQERMTMAKVVQARSRPFLAFGMGTEMR